jgi:hypothetical protein
MQALAIIALSILAAVVYGIVHDQVTARVCVEYFTIGQPPVFATESPTLLGVGWGIIATWWVGLLLGVPLALAARIGNRPKKSAQSLVRPVAILLGIMALCAILSGILGYLLGQSGAVILLEPLASRVPKEKHAAFLADGFAHSASYLVGFLGGIVLTVRTWRLRRGQTASS